MEDYIDLQGDIIHDWVIDCIVADMDGIDRPELLLLTENDVQAIIDGVTIH